MSILSLIILTMLRSNLTMNSKQVGGDSRCGPWRLEGRALVSQNVVRLRTKPMLYDNHLGRVCSPCCCQLLSTLANTPPLPTPPIVRLLVTDYCRNQEKVSTKDWKLVQTKSSLRPLVMSSIASYACHSWRYNHHTLRMDLFGTTGLAWVVKLLEGLDHFQEVQSKTS